MALWLVVRGTRVADARLLAAGGAVAGLAVLCSPPAGIVAAGDRDRRSESSCATPRTAIVPPLATLAVSAVWLGPLVWHYHRWGGFVRTSLVEPADPTLLQAVVAFGLTLPLGIGGLWLVRRASTGSPARPLVHRRRARRRLGAVGVRPRGQRPRSPGVLERPALPADARPGADVARRAGGRRRRRRSLRGRGRLALAAGLVVVATASTAAVAVAQSRHDESRPDTARLDCSPHVTIGPVDTVANVGVPHPAELTVFGATGARTVYSEAPRIRFRDTFTRLASQEERRAAAGRDRPRAAVPGRCPLGARGGARSRWTARISSPLPAAARSGEELTLYRAGG